MAEPRTLKSVFAQAEEQRTALEATDQLSTPSFNEDLSTALQSYHECVELISALSIFSRNESLEDIATSDLPYLLIDYHLGGLILRMSPTAPSERRRVLSSAREAYERYLHLLHDYSLLPDSDIRLLERYNEDPVAFSTVPTNDAAARRNSKIANFKTEKELRLKLEHLRQHPGYLDEGSGGDDEAVREAYLANAAYCTHMTFQALENINREVEILAQAPEPLLPPTTTIEEDERRRAESMKADGFTERLDRPFKRLQSAFGTGGPILSEKGKPLQPFTLLNDRQELQKGVFRPGHNLPTMTIDEYLDEERRRGGIIEGGGEASLRQEEPDEDNMERADAEIMRLREWDDFSEANPRGSGNTLNKG